MEGLNLQFSRLGDAGSVVKIGITKETLSRMLLRKARDLIRHNRLEERTL